MNTTKLLSRRRLLALVPAAAMAPATATPLAGLAAAVSTPVVALPAPIPDAPADNPDAELINLVDDWFAAKEEADRLVKVFTSFEEVFFQRRRQNKSRIPDAVRVRPTDIDLGIEKPEDRDVYRLADVAGLRSPRWSRLDISKDDGGELVFRSWHITPSADARARADEIIKVLDRHDRKPRGYRAAEREYHSAMNRSADIEDRIQETPARTLAGLTAKARVIHHGDLRHSGAMADSLADDLLVLNDAATT
jgi:hypothetical protein